MSHSHTKLKSINFYSGGEKPVLNLVVSRECIEWLIGVIPSYDEARRTLQRELDSLSDDEVSHGS